ncbi:MAG: metal ABC transporter solute-binding protein, Zn/Mn family [Nitrospirota bacterium]
MHRAVQALILFICILLTLPVMSCRQKSKQNGAEKKLVVVASLFPLYDFARNIGKEKTEVVLLLPPGVEPHSYEPGPGDVLKIHEADIFLYTGDTMEPWITTIRKSIRGEKPLIVDTGQSVRADDGHDPNEDDADHHGGQDPHIWLDFSYAQKMIDAILEGFVRTDPENRVWYEKNAEAYKRQLQDLDARFSDTLASCKKRTIVHGGHFAFGYLAARYRLQYLSAYQGFSPNAEPSPQNLIGLVNKLRGNNLRFLFYEELIVPRVAETLARETGAGLLKLNGAHNVTKEELRQGVTFISLMEQNLESLRKGLECRER